MKPFADAARRHGVLLAALIAGLIGQPLLARASSPIVIASDTGFGLLLLFVFLNLCSQPWERRTGVLLFVCVVAANLAAHGLAGRSPDVAAVLFHGTVTIFLGFAVVVIVRLLARTTVIRADDVLGAVCGYIIAAVAWSHVYALAYVFAPNAFGVNPEIASQLADWRLRRPLLDHLSFTTLTSIGYSDITPVGAPMYALTWIETIFGQFYMAVVVAQLVGLKLAQAVGTTARDRT